MYIGLHVRYPLFLSGFHETWFLSTDLRKNDTNIKFHENLSIGSRSVPCGRTDGQTDRRVDRRTDVTKLIVAFRNLATVPKKGIKQLKDDKIHQILCSLFRDFRNRWKKVMEKVTPEPFWSLMFF